MVELTLDNIDAIVASGGDLRNTKFEVSQNNASMQTESKLPKDFDPVRMTLNMDPPEPKNELNSVRERLADKKQDEIEDIEKNQTLDATQHILRNKMMQRD